MKFIGGGGCWSVVVVVTVCGDLPCLVVPLGAWSVLGDGVSTTLVVPAGRATSVAVLFALAGGTFVGGGTAFVVVVVTLAAASVVAVGVGVSL